MKNSTEALAEAAQIIEGRIHYNQFILDYINKSNYNNNADSLNEVFYYLFKLAFPALTINPCDSPKFKKPFLQKTKQCLLNTISFYETFKKILGNIQVDNRSRVIDDLYDTVRYYLVEEENTPYIKDQDLGNSSFFEKVFYKEINTLLDPHISPIQKQCNAYFIYSTLTNAKNTNINVKCPKYTKMYAQKFYNLKKLYKLKEIEPPEILKTYSDFEDLHKIYIEISKKLDPNDLLNGLRDGLYWLHGTYIFHLDEYSKTYNEKNQKTPTQKNDPNNNEVNTPNSTTQTTNNNTNHLPSPPLSEKKPINNTPEKSEKTQTPLSNLFPPKKPTSKQSTLPKWWNKLSTNNQKKLSNIFDLDHSLTYDKIHNLFEALGGTITNGKGSSRRLENEATPQQSCEVSGGSRY